MRWDLMTKDWIFRGRWSAVDECLIIYFISSYFYLNLCYVTSYILTLILIIFIVIVIC